MSLTHLALAYVNSRPFVTSNIIGATTMEQLKENIESINNSAGRAVNRRIEVILSPQWDEINALLNN